MVELSQFDVSCAWLWLRGPLIGLYRELLAAQWSATDVARALQRARATTRDRVPTEAVLRRLRVLDWAQQEFHALWHLFAGSSQSRPAEPGLFAERPEVPSVVMSHGGTFDF